MDKQTQDLSWACLPKEAREEIKGRYKEWSKGVAFETEIILYEDLFGRHNLTSDTEPKEMLFVERKKVQELHKRFQKYKTEESLKGDTDFYDGELNALNILFGDKCLPDKPINGAIGTTPPSYKLDVKPKHVTTEAACNIRGIEIVEYDTPNTPNFDVSNDNIPKYSKGDSVLFIPTQIVYDVEEYIQDRQVYKLQRMGGFVTAFVKESDLEPYKELEHRLEQPSVQVEPKYKFSLGQEVILHFHGGEKATISERLPPQDGIVWNCYKVKGLPHHIWRENELDPYVEKPLTYDVGQRVRVINVTNLAILHKIGTIEELPNNSHYDMYKVRFANGYSHLEASKLEPYTEPEAKNAKLSTLEPKLSTLETESHNLSQEIANCDKTEDNQLKDNMEEKELNLCELLKGCEEVELYSPIFDNVTLIKANSGNTMYPIQVLPIDCTDRTLSFGANGTFWEEDYPNGKCMLFPSRALYEKYPLDARKAWQVWASERKPKVKLHVSYEIIQGCLHGCGDFPTLEFYTEEEAQQAAEVVRECLEKFHKDHQ